jgi:methylmalonyl-CoA mutase C-terminal domain/subunit
MERKRILVAKPGLDGHDRGARVVVDALRRAGFEVIYTGIRQTPEAIASIAEQEAVEAIGLSILSGAHLELTARVIDCLRGRGLGDVPVFVGGIIPDEDVETLTGLGVRAAFGPGTATTEFVEKIRTTLAAVPA